MADINIAKQIIDAVGGEENVKTLGHCMTRLRFALKNENKADDAAAKSIKVVKGLSKSAGQYQMILGTGVVDDYYDLIDQNYTFGKQDYTGVVETEDLEDGSKGNPLTRAIGKALGILSGSIAPWLGCIMGSLMISAILSLLTSLGLLNAESSTYAFFSTVSGVCVYSLPVLIGFSAAEKLQTNKYMGALLGAIMIYPGLMNAIAEGSVSLFGLSIQNFSYTSTIVPVILAVWVLKYVEKLAKKICPQVIYIFGVTLIELLITVPLVYLIVGPIGAVITNGISSLVLSIYAHAGMLAPAVAGAIMPLAVMAGVHLGLFPIATLMISDVGFDPVIHPALMVYNMSIAGASFAYGLRSKKMDDKSLGISSGISGLLGISEAGLFGVVLPNKRVLATTEIGILISGVITGLVGYKCYVPLSQSVFAIPAAAHDDFNLIACTISLVSGLAASFVVTYLFGMKSKKDSEDDHQRTANEVETTVDDVKIVALADGEMIDVTAVSDPVFSEKALGESAAFRFAGDKVVLCAPANGILSALFPTCHAYGITMENGMELMVHCGVNTVESDGDGFQILDKKLGDHVKAGDPIVEVDLKKLSAQYDMSTILVVTNDNGKDFEFIAPGSVKKGQSILK
ncbi:MAG TPA: PTS glucose transporter subunit IIA [Candidatus Anaerostipes excrementavium]|uniref:PTS glucose transporter subunit IIA n=1 Tax=Candidatus Anaerostipes excrementavium TaxID=2838463 RepID=A0A9D1WYX2_9FIRM|nr:PTS glucose transporter subunit IIA [uncultured Anaerostipes sp.]HIX68555.1 PTS glucose transporter subunit IIA [Candidatus Anaerostipes excrementavium]